jgi:hypothetical protein
MVFAVGIEAEEKIGNKLVVFLYEKPIELDKLMKRKTDEPVYEE